MCPIADDSNTWETAKTLLPGGEGALHRALRHRCETALPGVGVPRGQRQLLQVARTDTGRTVDQASWPANLLQHLAPHFDFTLVLVYDWSLIQGGDIVAMTRQAA